MRWFITGIVLAATVQSCDIAPRAAAHDADADPAAGSVVAIGEMNAPRAAHTATTLPDGRVLIVGGMTGDEGSTAGAEMFDPATGDFEPAAEMQVRRHSHTATPLPDGSVLIAGGFDATGRYLASAEVYDPAAGNFSPLASMHTARAGHVAVVLDDGRVLMIGGVGSGWTFLANSEIYDPATGSFTAAGDMSVPRESHAAVRLPDGRVLVIGGHVGRHSNITLHASAELFDPATGTFSDAGELSIRRHKHDAVLLPDGNVLVTGGTDERDSRGVYRSAELRAAESGAFERSASLRLPRYKHRGTSVVLPDGRVLLAGGATRAEVYDPHSGTSSIVAGDDPLAGNFSAIAPLADGSVLITGGYGADIGPRSSAWLYRPASDR